MWETLNPWSQATDGVFGGPWCQGTRGVFCPGKRVIVSPAPEEVEPLDKRRHERDMKDLSDLIDILANMAT